MENFNTYTKELQNMELRLTDMEDKIDVIDKKLTQVVDAILGNPLTKTGGFIHDLEIMKIQILEIEKKQIKYEEFKKKISWTVGIIIAAAAILQFFSNIYSNLKL
jgi:hypothetical protein